MLFISKYESIKFMRKKALVKLSSHLTCIELLNEIIISDLCFSKELFMVVKGCTRKLTSNYSPNGSKDV